MTQPLEIGVCTWSLHRTEPLTALRMAVNVLNLPRVQLGFFGRPQVEAADSTTIAAVVSETGARIAALFVGFDDVNRSTIDDTQRTEGFADANTLEDRLDLVVRVCRLAGSLGVEYVALHVGRIPDMDQPDRMSVMLDRVRRAADTAVTENVSLLVETGQESASVLLGFFRALDRPNVGVNFDPGNFVTYGTDDPVAAATTLCKLVRNVHTKDFVASTEPGSLWGSPTSLGTGDANLPRVISKLRARGYNGPLLIERPGDADPKGVRDDRDYLQSLFG